MLARVLVPPVLLEPLIFQPPMATADEPALYSSMNSSLPPTGPRARNSLTTTPLGEASAAGTSAPAVTSSAIPASAARAMRVCMYRVPSWSARRPERRLAAGEGIAPAGRVERPPCATSDLLRIDTTRCVVQGCAERRTIPAASRPGLRGLRRRGPDGRPGG